MIQMAFFDIMTALYIASPHILYAIIWFLPHLWRQQFGVQAVQRFAQVASAGKVLQFTAVGTWFWLRRGSLPSLSQALASNPVYWWLPCLLLVAIGQVLNVAIYQAIGQAGVYYGFKLGRPVPWHTGFPFNVVSHPQYVGSIMTVWGLGGLVWHMAPQGFTLLLAYWTGLYVMTGLQEQLF